MKGFSPRLTLGSGISAALLSKRQYFAFATAIAIISRQLDLFGNLIPIVQIVTLEDSTEGVADAHSTEWLLVLAGRFRAQRFLFDIIRLERSPAPMPDSLGPRRPALDVSHR